MQCGHRYAGLPLCLQTYHDTIGLLRYRTSVYRPLVCYRPSAFRPFCICGPYWDPILLGPYVHCTSSQVLNGFKRSAMQQQTCTGPSNSAIVTSDSFVLGIFDSVSDCFYVYF